MRESTRRAVQRESRENQNRRVQGKVLRKQGQANPNEK